MLYLLQQLISNKMKRNNLPQNKDHGFLFQNLRKQVMTTNLWIEQYWFDYKLVWNPAEYGGVDILHVPSSQIWLPDIVLYNKSVLHIHHLKINMSLIKIW